LDSVLATMRAPARSGARVLAATVATTYEKGSCISDLITDPPTKGGHDQAHHTRTHRRGRLSGVQRGSTVRADPKTQPAPRTRRAYWHRNLTYVGILLGVWFVVSYGFGILLVDHLNAVRIGGFQLGFWFAQQGSIYVFVILIFVYVGLMNRLDRSFEVDERDDRT
jgi:putative solute:sodium symporter small subunit